MKRRNMTDHKSKLNRELVKGLILLGLGVVLFVFSMFTFKSHLFIPYHSIIEGIGLFLAVVGIWNLIQHLRYQKHPDIAKRAMVESTDERQLLIKSRSGNNAFKVGVTATYLALLFAGATEDSISSDLAWWVLAGIVVLTLIVYIVSIIRYEKMY